ncbi:MAG TPA: CcmD family protein [Thermoguttaceae bacterium]|nr:CcmD family protein [Thermoguttaceae bacterium]
MQTFIAAYVIVWAAVLWYVLRLGANQRRLQRELESLRLELGEPGEIDQPNQRAA